MLVELRLEELRLRLDDLVEDGLLDDLGEVREDGDVAYLLAAGDGGALAFLEGDHATDLEVIGDDASVESGFDVEADLVVKLRRLCQNVAVETIRSEAFVEVGLLDRAGDVLSSEERSLLAEKVEGTEAWKLLLGLEVVGESLVNDVLVVENLAFGSL